jgi:undecaprenyl-diphosphatase
VGDCWLADRLCSPGTRAHVLVALISALVVSALAISTGLIAVGLIATHIGPLERWDDRVSVWFADRRSPALTTISYWGTYIANTMGVVVVAAVVTAMFAARRVGRVAAVIVCGLAIEIVVFLITNYTVARPRPDVSHLGSTPSTYSFPSGHAAATLVLYVGIAFLVRASTRNALLRAIAVVVAVTFPLWVAFSRVYRGQHHLTDVIAGLLMGAAALTAAVLSVQTAPQLADATDRERAALDKGEPR